MIYPWQEKNWQQLIARYRSHNLPHAMLFTGIAGLGKCELATNLARFLLCKNNQTSDYACAACDSCSLFKAGTHPDFLLVQPEDVGKAIKVEQIRKMIGEASSTAHQGGMRIVVIDAADAMNNAAANALLKTLEEPAGEVMLILISARPSSLPATIISRCQKIAIVPPSFGSAAHWLKEKCPKLDEVVVEAALRFTNNAPLQALSLLQDDDDKLALRQKILEELLLGWCGKMPQMNAITFATTYSDVDSAFLVQLFLSIVGDLIKLQFSARAEFITNVEQADMLSNCCKCFAQAKLFAYRDYLLEIMKVISSNITLNKQLLLENLWLRLNEALCSSQTGC